MFNNKGVELKKVATALLNDLSITDIGFKKVIASYYAKSMKPVMAERKARDLKKKLDNASITWNAFLQLLEILELRTTAIGVKLRMPTGKDKYGEPTEIIVDFDNHEVSALQTNALKGLISKVLIETRLRQTTYHARIEKWYQDSPDTDKPVQVDMATTSFIKKLNTGNISWITFIDAISMTLAGDVQFFIEGMLSDGTEVKQLTPLDISRDRVA